MNHKAYTIRLNPSAGQTEMLKQHGGAVRWLWNYMLSLNIEHYNEQQKFIFGYEQHNLLPELKKEYDWLKQINSQSLQAKCMDLDAGLKRKIAKKSTCGFPKFKKKTNQSDSFRVPQFFRLSNKKIYLPKIGWIKWKPHRKFNGKVKHVTIKQDLDNWVAIVTCETNDIPIRTDFINTDIIGIDVGIKDFAVLSDGTKIDNPKHFQNAEKLLKKKQQKLSKKNKQSNNRNKARYQVAKLHRKVKNQRKDFQWKLASSITKNYSVVCVENLNIDGMMKNRKLAKAISSVGWYSFNLKLQHKLSEIGGQLVKINRFAPSSKMCNSCGVINKALTLENRYWTCNCGVTHDRDINAAINIKSFGLEEINRLGTSRIYACGESYDGDVARDTSSYDSSKQENLVVGLEI